MQRLEGDELRRYAEQRGICKPELAEALKKLQAHQRQGQEHFNANVLRRPAQSR